MLTGWNRVSGVLRHRTVILKAGRERAGGRIWSALPWLLLLRLPVTFAMSAIFCEESFMKKIGLILGVLLTVLSLTACNTVQGLGKDIEKGGQKIEKAAS